jgi:hypothetical protein
MDAVNVCPKCYSKKIEYRGKIQLMINSFSIGAGLFVGSLFIPFLRYFAWFAMFVVIVAPFTKSHWNCNECHHWWKVSTW